MSSPIWYSSMIRRAVVIEGETPIMYMDSLLLFRAANWDDAFQRALNLGRSRERQYLNGKNQSVAWKLSRIISLDELGSELIDGIEVYSGPADPTGDEHPSHSPTFAPERSTPTQTL
jgi:uncharacterized protein DUF4288